MFLKSFLTIFITVGKNLTSWKDSVTFFDKKDTGSLLVVSGRKGSLGLFLNSSAALASAISVESRATVFVLVSVSSKVVKSSFFSLCGSFNWSIKKRVLEIPISFSSLAFSACNFFKPSVSFKVL